MKSIQSNIKKAKEYLDKNHCIAVPSETVYGFAGNAFSDISVKLENGVLNIFIKENPIVNTVVFNGEKAKKFKETLSSLLSIREKGSFIKSNLKSDINLIKEFYRNLGFYFIKIDAEIEKLPKNRVNLIYTLDKGERAKIAKIFFLGDKKHWRTVNETLCTFLTSKVLIERYWEKLNYWCKFEHYPFEKPLHEIYEKEYCLSPIPSLAIHCTNINSVFGLSPNFKWKKIWEENEVK